MAESDYIVIRDPANSQVDGRWYDRRGMLGSVLENMARRISEAGRIRFLPAEVFASDWIPPPPPPGFERTLYGPTGETETREDGAVAEVYRRQEARAPVVTPRGMWSSARRRMAMADPAPLTEQELAQLEELAVAVSPRWSFGAPRGRDAVEVSHWGQREEMLDYIGAVSPGNVLRLLAEVRRLRGLVTPEERKNLVHLKKVLDDFDTGYLYNFGEPLEVALASVIEKLAARSEEQNADADA